MLFGETHSLRRVTCCRQSQLTPHKGCCVPFLCNEAFDVFCCEALVRLWGEGVMINIKKGATFWLDQWQQSHFRQGSRVNNAKAIFPLCLILHCFCKENFCLLSKSYHPRLSSRLSNHQSDIKCCKAVQLENFQKSEPISRAAVVENVFCSRQNFPSVLSTEKFTDFSQWNLLEFIGSWLAVTD